MKGSISFIIRVIISITLVGWLVWREDPARVWGFARGADFGTLVAAFGFYLIAITMGSFKWKILLDAQGVHLPFIDVVRSSFVSLFFGNFLPSNIGGDVVRAFDISRKTDNAPAVSASVIVDRLTGLMVFSGSAAIMSVISLFVLDDSVMVPVTLASVAIFLGLLVVFAALTSRRVGQFGKNLFRLVPRLEPLRATGRSVSAAFVQYRRQIPAVLTAGLFSFGIQCLTSLVNWMVALSLGLDIPLVYIFVFNPLVAFLLLVPISINGIGYQQGIYIYFYSTVTGRAGADQVLTMSLLMQTIILLSSLLGGLFWLQRRAAPVPA